MDGSGHILLTSCDWDNHGLNTLKDQPAKLAAIEGHWETNRDHGMPLSLFALPNMETNRTILRLVFPIWQFDSNAFPRGSGHGFKGLRS